MLAAWSTWSRKPASQSCLPRYPGVSEDVLVELVCSPALSTRKDARDRAILLLMAETALRRAEVCSLNRGDFRPATGELLVLGKGRGTERTPLHITPAVVEAIAAYLTLTALKQAEDPLFGSEHHDPRYQGRRLTGAGLYHVIQRRGGEIGLASLTPHKIRHSAITLALDATNGNIRDVQRVSRHASPATVMIYDDNREDRGGRVTEAVSERLRGASGRRPRSE